MTGSSHQGDATLQQGHGSFKDVKIDGSTLVSLRFWTNGRTRPCIVITPRSEILVYLVSVLCSWYALLAYRDAAQPSLYSHTMMVVCLQAGSQ